jgi:hypothetical protein
VYRQPIPLIAGLSNMPSFEEIHAFLASLAQKEIYRITFENDPETVGGSETVVRADAVLRAEADLCVIVIQFRKDLEDMEARHHMVGLHAHAKANLLVRPAFTNQPHLVRRQSLIIGHLFFSVSSNGVVGNLIRVKHALVPPSL